MKMLAAFWPSTIVFCGFAAFLFPLYIPVGADRVSVAHLFGLLMMAVAAISVGARGKASGFGRNRALSSGLPYVFAAFVLYSLLVSPLKKHVLISIGSMTILGTTGLLFGAFLRSRKVETYPVLVWLGIAYNAASLACYAGTLLGHIPPESFFASVEWDRSQPRLSFFFGDPNFWVLPQLVFIWAAWSVSYRLTAAAFAVVGALSFSNSFFIALLVSIACLVCERREGERRSIAYLLPAGFLVLLVLSMGLWLGRMKFLPLSAYVFFDKFTYLSGRFELWGEGGRLYTESPWTGIGYGMNRSRMAHAGLNNELHNTFLDYFVDLGFWGGFLYIGILIMTFLNFDRARSERSLRASFLGYVVMSASLTLYFSPLLALYLALSFVRSPSVQGEGHG